MDKLLQHMENTFVVVCIVLACFMTTKETLRYFKNEDTSTVSYKYFASSQRDSYPIFSFCLTDTEDLGLIYSYFKYDIKYTFPVLNGNYSTFVRMLKGQNAVLGVGHEEGVDIRNLSEAYANTFEFKFKWLYRSIEFKTEQPNDSLTFNAGLDYDSPLPFYVSYQDPDRVCFTRKEDRKDNIIRIEDTFSTNGKIFSRYSSPAISNFDRRINLKIFIHHPGQLLRVFDSPVFESRIDDFGWDQPVINFKISQVSILRKRHDGNNPCNIDLRDDDLQLRKKVAEEVGCIPVYWKNIMHTQRKLETCKTSKNMNDIWNMLQNFSRIHSKYLPSCNEMKLSVALDRRISPTFSQDLFVQFKYMDKTYEEIINVRDFGLESLWSTVGGLIGIFVGTSLSQVPSLVAITWNWVQNQIK